MNLLGKLYYVYYVFPPDTTPNFIEVTRTHDDYLGCSRVEGIFRTKREAEVFAAKQERRLKAAA